MPSLRTRVAGLCCAALIALPGAVAAQSDDAQSGDTGTQAGSEDTAADTQASGGDKTNPVVAVVNGEEITYREVIESAQQLPQQYRSQIDRIFPALVERMVDMELLGQAAADSGLGDSEAVKERMAELKTQVVREVYLQNKIDAYITDERLQEAYAEYKKNNPPQQQVHARHILVKEEAKAKELIGQLEEGADFAELAKQHSTGPSASRGGDLGFFGKEEMVEPFAEAAFRLEPGAYTKQPVKTQFGWHVIKVVETRDQEPKSFAEMEDQLRQDMQRQAVEQVVSDLREGAEVETFPERRQQVEGEPDVGGGQGGGLTVAPGDGSGSAQ